MSGTFLDWDEVGVNEWLGKAGYPQYEENVIGALLLSPCL